MKPAFIHDDFLLQTAAARRLYHEYAEGMPIIDYHCHLLPGEIAEDKRWDNLAQVWLYGDHYKWRAMRANGVPELYCTGKASDREKFQMFAETMPRLLRNPIYHWSHLELARHFDVADVLLSPATAEDVWERTSRKLASGSISARQLILSSRVKLLCTTDDPTDSLEHHAALARDTSFSTKVLPTWRPDRGMAVESPTEFNRWVDSLGAAADMEIRDFGSYLEALRRRHDQFHSAGCRMSDHGLEMPYGEDYTEDEIRATFAKVRAGAEVDRPGALKFRSAMMVEFALLDHEKGWAQQLHIGALRNNNGRMFATLGPDSGYDSIGDCEMARPLARFLDRLERGRRLPKTILYNLNPRDNELLAAMAGNFQDGSSPGKLQLGSGWWFLDQKDGMERQIEALSQIGLLSRFVGMVTDSRSFLSYARHEYFRRILCNILGEDMERGLVPGDFDLVGGMVRDICYNNVQRYLGVQV
jgi:glucuronate isomerase